MKYFGTGIELALLIHLLNSKINFIWWAYEKIECFVNYFKVLLVANFLFYVTVQLLKNKFNIVENLAYIFWQQFLLLKMFYLDKG